MGTLRQNMAIDLGSSNVRICVERRGIVLNETSAVTINKKTGELLAIGKAARSMMGKTEEDIVTIKPIKNGVISDYTIAVNMVGYYMDRSIKNPVRRLIRPDVITAIHSGTTNVGRRAAERALKEAGAGRIFFVETPLASAVGANLDVAAPNGKMVVNVGGEVTDIAAISYNGIVAALSVPVGGSTFDEAIKNYFKKEYKMVVSDQTAEKIKDNNACAYRDVSVDPFEVLAVDLTTRLPIEKVIKPDELIKPLSESLMPILDGIRTVLEQTPPEIASDIFERGIVLTGGGSQLAGLDIFISRGTGIDTRVAEKPGSCVVSGLIKILNSMSNEKKNELMSD